MVSSTSVATAETDDAVYTANRTVMADIPHIEQLLSSVELNTYPQSSLQIGRVVETSVISVTLFKAEFEKKSFSRGF